MAGNKPRWEVKYEKFKAEEPVTDKIETMKKEIEDIKQGRLTNSKAKTKEEYKAELREATRKFTR